MRLTTLPLLLVVFVLLPGITAAQEPVPQPAPSALQLIDSGRAALVAGNGQEAIDYLQKAIGLIQDSVTKTLSAFLLESVGDLKGGKIDAQNGAWGSGENAFQWNSASRKYRRESTDLTASDNLVVDVMISNSPQLLEMHKASFKIYEDPRMREMMEKNGGMKIETIEDGAWQGMIISQPGQGAQLLAFAQKLMVQIQTSAGDIALVKKFWEAMDTAGLAGSR